MARGSRYTLDVDLKTVVTPEKLESTASRVEARKVNAIFFMFPHYNSLSSSAVRRWGSPCITCEQRLVSHKVWKWESESFSCVLEMTIPHWSVVHHFWLFAMS